MRFAVAKILLQLRIQQGEKCSVLKISCRTFTPPRTHQHEKS